jgi:hypothetical protein
MGEKGRRLLLKRFQTQIACEAWFSLLHRVVETNG